MELSEFVKETLDQIIEGVKKAQEPTCKFEDGQINSIPKSSENMAFTGLSIHNIHFDVAITVAQDEGAKTKIGILTGIMGIGAEANTKESNITQNRIKIDIPISYPMKRLSQ